MTTMAWLGPFARDRSGATAIEYAMVAGLLSIAIIGGASILGTNLNAFFDGVANHPAWPF